MELPTKAPPRCLPIPAIFAVAPPAPPGPETGGWSLWLLGFGHVLCRPGLALTYRWCWNVGGSEFCHKMEMNDAQAATTRRSGLPGSNPWVPIHRKSRCLPLCWRAQALQTALAAQWEGQSMDIQNDIKTQQGAGYQRWATIENLKRAAARR